MGSRNKMKKSFVLFSIFYFMIFGSEILSHPLASLTSELDVNQTIIELKKKLQVVLNTQIRSELDIDLSDTVEQGILSEMNEDPQADVGKETEDDTTKLSNFELSIVRCCSSDTDNSFDRCFEVNGFGGVNFVVEPCQYLKELLSKLGMD